MDTLKYPSIPIGYTRKIPIGYAAYTRSTQGYDCGWDWACSLGTASLPATSLAAPGYTRDESLQARSPISAWFQSTHPTSTLTQTKQKKQCSSVVLTIFWSNEIRMLRRRKKIFSRSVALKPIPRYEALTSDNRSLTTKNPQLTTAHFSQC
jgi:hypothetical protein